MKELKVEIELLSETIFGNGEEGEVSVHMDILKDKYGIPYLKSKTFKGKLREEVSEIAALLKMKHLENRLFGISESGDNKILRFSDCKLEKNILNNLIYAIEEDEILTKDEITNALTEIRTFTKLNEYGVAKDKSLRNVRVIKKGLKFYCDINPTEELSLEEKGLLACGISALKNLGSMESRGKGQVKCRLLEDDKDITYECIEKLQASELESEVI